MSNKRKSKLMRLLNKPEALRKFAESMLKPLTRDLVYEGRVRGLFKSMAKPCSKCHVSLYEHETEGTHPFFHNNLELLEWLNEKKENKTA